MSVRPAALHPQLRKGAPPPTSSACRQNSTWDCKNVKCLRFRYPRPWRSHGRPPDVWIRLGIPRRCSHPSLRTPPWHPPPAFGRCPEQDRESAAGFAQALRGGGVGAQMHQILWSSKSQRHPSTAQLCRSISCPSFQCTVHAGGKGFASLQRGHEMRRGLPPASGVRKQV